MHVTVYQTNNEEPEDYIYKTVGEIETLIRANGKVQFEYDEENDAISALLPCEECDEFICECDDEEDLDDVEEDEEDEEE